MGNARWDSRQRSHHGSNAPTNWTRLQHDHRASTHGKVLLGNSFENGDAAAQGEIPGEDFQIRGDEALSKRTLVDMGLRGRRGIRNPFCGPWKTHAFDLTYRLRSEQQAAAARYLLGRGRKVRSSSKVAALLGAEDA